MGIESLSSRPGLSESKTRPPDFYDPEKAPKREEVVGTIPDAEKKRWAEIQKEDGLKAEVDMFVELNQEALGISKFGMKQARARILEQYTFLKEAEAIQDIDKYDWKGFLAKGEQKATETARDTAEASREDTETTRKTLEKDSEERSEDVVDQNIDKEKSIDNYLGFIQAKRQEGLSSRVIISQLLNPDIKKGFEMPAEYLPELVKFQQLLDMDLGADNAQMESFVSAALADQQSFHSIAENIFASQAVSETTKMAIAEKFNVPYIATKTDFRAASLGLQKNLDELKATGETLRQNKSKLEDSLDTVESELAELEDKQLSGTPLSEKESARLQELKEAQKDLKKRLQENQETQVANKKNLESVTTDENGHPVLQYCDFDVSVDQANHQAIFKTEFGDCSVPLSWYNYSMFAGEKVTNHINSFLLSTQFSKAGLSDHLFSEENRTDFMSSFMRSAGIGEPGKLATSHDLDQTKDLLKIFSPDPMETGSSSETAKRNLKNIGLLDPAGHLDPGKWKDALAFIDINKHTSHYTSQHLKDFLTSA